MSFSVFAKFSSWQYYGRILDIADASGNYTNSFALFNSAVTSTFGAQVKQFKKKKLFFYRIYFSFLLKK